MSEIIGDINGLIITSFAGRRGICIQLTTPVKGYSQLDKGEVMELIEILNKWVET